MNSDRFDSMGMPSGILSDLMASWNSQEANGHAGRKSHCGAFLDFCGRYLEVSPTQSKRILNLTPRPDESSNECKSELWSNCDFLARDVNGDVVAIICQSREDAKAAMRRIGAIATLANSSDWANTPNFNNPPSQILLIVGEPASGLEPRDAKFKPLEDFLEKSPLPTTLVRLEDILRDGIDWNAFNPLDLRTLVAKGRKTLMPHQEKALAAIGEEFKTAPRAKLIMACGTGKTLTSVAIMDKTLEGGDMGLFLFPSLSLLSQTFVEACAQAKGNFIPHIVCSDGTVGKNNEMKSFELPITPTTNSYKLATMLGAWLHREKDLPREKRSRTIIFSTYQSIDVVILAQALIGREPFKLIVCDEAHRTTGHCQEGDSDGSYYIKVHREPANPGKETFKDGEFLKLLEGDKQWNPENGVPIEAMARHAAWLLRRKRLREQAKSLDGDAPKQEELFQEHDNIHGDDASKLQIEHGDIKEIFNWDSGGIAAKRRLYMTATPRIFSEKTKLKGLDENVFLYGMDDEEIYGRTAFELTFGEALDLGLLTEYQVHLNFIPRDEVNKLGNALLAGAKEGKISAPDKPGADCVLLDKSQCDHTKGEAELVAQILSAWGTMGKIQEKKEKAILEWLKDGKDSKEADSSNAPCDEEELEFFKNLYGEKGEKWPGGQDDITTMKTAISFNASIKLSKARTLLSNLLEKHRCNGVLDILDPDRGRFLPHLASRHIDGEMNQSQKSERLAWLAKGDPDEAVLKREASPNEDNLPNVRILSNARCLTEGVDVPALDAIIFYDTHYSLVDIIQAVGRVMRRSPGKKLGHIIIPIVVDTKYTAGFNNFLESDKFRPVWKILMALKCHDMEGVGKVGN